ncbi:MAG TPA: hypothetical protein PKC18_13870 [Lacipirellulaceae bacterium]|nr:hypothetical protein [Lacipirellulaceae bacterium]HMP07660.1 hypothetical protein [Lacipirellulaceae bacterium]
MTSITLADSVVQALAAKAQSEGMTIEGFLAHVATTPPAREQPPLSADEFERLLDEVAVPGQDPNCTYSRAEIYRDHD